MAKVTKMIPGGMADVEAQSPAPIKLPETLAAKMREKLAAYRTAEQDFNASLKGWVEGFMSTQPPPPEGYNTHVDPENGIVFFIKAEPTRPE